ncbi:MULTISPECIES: D-glycero-D-manno-heptose 1-phosphate guanosyltransferase [Campylobacter]|uniref:D-glycero-D-manno-heptose 1-phosphate guanosyltransferase n=1 Tax=Campylobacter TaxID=194 RepID=UPI000A3381F3|nr:MULTISPECIES: nucleotidyltransferase family protein [unclassified Campylobacter]MBE6430619.1 D-glycero-D-manno-heptose 1-phosphate guanosyltransferase [Campylobacter sp.]MBO5063484.1 nucleotidyltransferase family protein [Campylobacter sp.]MBQ8820533.1 nucleotidyltransferase family protein [Campylobacter sp.]
MDTTKEAIILCGGLGTRLRSVISDVPKPMAPINNKPFLAFVLEYLKKQNISRVVLAVSYKYEIIQEYFGNSYLGMQILYSIEKEPLGTGGAILEALNLINSDSCYVLNGDTFFDVNLDRLKLDNSDICVALKPMKNFDRYGSVDIDNNSYISAFNEKKFTSNGLINGGVYLIKKNIFNSFNLPNKFSFEEFFQENFLIFNAKATVFDDYFIDIGIPQDYKAFIDKNS